MNPIDRIRKYFGSVGSKKEPYAEHMPLRVRLPSQLNELYLPGIHGIEHSFRVLRLVNELATLVRLSSRQQKWLQFCAIFHDIGRIDDSIDCLHGKRTLSILKHNDFWELTNFNVPLVHFIIANHCIDDSQMQRTMAKYRLKDREEAIFLLKLFKDADNLDRVRIGDFDPAYLRNESARSLIRMASQQYHSDISKEAAENELQAAFLSLGNAT